MFGGLASSRMRSLYFDRTSGSRLPDGSSVVKSSLPLITSWVWRSTLSETWPLILSTLPLFTPGTLKFLFLVSTNSLLGSTTFSVYGPEPIGGFLVMSLIGELDALTGAA